MTENPSMGGVYQRDPETDQLTLVEQTQPATAGFFAPAENEVEVNDGPNT
jgi:hypothetical protein